MNHSENKTAELQSLFEDVANGITRIEEMILDDAFKPDKVEPFITEDSIPGIRYTAHIGDSASEDMFALVSVWVNNSGWGLDLFDNERFLILSVDNNDFETFSSEPLSVFNDIFHEKLIYRVDAETMVSSVPSEKERRELFTAFHVGPVCSDLYDKIYNEVEGKVLEREWVEQREYTSWEVPINEDVSEEDDYEEMTSDQLLNF